MEFITAQQIKEIADELDTGMRCFWNRKTNELAFVPDEMSMPDFDTEPWQEEFDKIEEHAGDYVEIERPQSRDSFQFMEEFTESLPDNLKLKSTLLRALERKKPFREFKYEIDDSGEYREQWFAFKDSKLRQWVKDQIEDIVGRDE